MEHGATEHEVGERVWKGHCFDGFHPKVVRRESRREGCGEAARLLNRLRICIHAEYVVPLHEKVDQVPARSAARIEHAHPRPDPASKQLIEKVDVDLAALLLKYRLST